MNYFYSVLFCFFSATKSIYQLNLSYVVSGMCSDLFFFSSIVR